MVYERGRYFREQQFDDRWEQYIYETFGEANTPTKIRQRQLLLDISKEKRPVPRTEFRQLSPALAVAYASKGP